jgi:glyoxylase-like metal-dependent hydrolase (beta-lactamase superfamily II)
VSVAPGVRRIVAGNAGLMTGPGTNTYLFGLREVAVLDPGPDDALHLEAILAAAGHAIRWIIVTHTHPDHSPLASRLAERTGARVIGAVERHRWARLTLEAHLIKLARECRASERDGLWRPSHP